ncbi:MAG TPA: ABC transporter permease, partial [Phycisphaerae bacterium]
MFFLLRIFLMSIRGLRANLFRSLLATLGVIIGVSAVVAAMGILEGANRDILKRFESLGADQIIVVNGSDQRRSRQSPIPTLTPDDAEAIVTDAGSIVKAAAGEVQSGAQIKYFDKNKSVTVLATSESYAAMNNYKVIEGEFFTREEVRAERKVCALGYKVARDLFGESAVVGHYVKIGGQSFYIKAVMEKKGFLGFREVDSQVVIPLSTGMKRMFGVKYVNMVTVQARDPKRLDAAIEKVKGVLRHQHNIRAGADDDFTIFTQEQAKANVADFTKIFAVVLYSISGISLVVGGIGIMNIMMVSVTERTREIGVRMAVGARRFDILRQFLIEASIISFLGGALGVLLGLAVTDLLENFTRVLKTYNSPWGILIALAMATLVGIISGLWPAIRASMLDPVESRRN